VVVVNLVTSYAVKQKSELHELQTVRIFRDIVARNEYYKRVINASVLFDRTCDGSGF